MSQHLLDATVAHLRSEFPRDRVATVQPYAGEFSAAEVGELSFTAPALLPTVLGWSPVKAPERLPGRDVLRVRMALFIVTKHPQRMARAAQCMQLAQLASLALQQWRLVDGGLPVAISTLLEPPRAENLYGRAIDAKGLALWMLTYDQEVKPLVPLPQLYDLLAIEIIDTTRQGAVPAPAPAPGPGLAPLTVTEEVLYAPLPTPQP